MARKPISGDQFEALGCGVLLIAVGVGAIFGAGCGFLSAGAGIIILTLVEWRNRPVPETAYQAGDRVRVKRCADHQECGGAFEGDVFEVGDVRPAIAYVGNDELDFPWPVCCVEPAP